jgi:hypothetical protein
MRIIVLIALSLCACKQTSSEQAPGPTIQNSAEYGPLVPITGVYVTSFELSALRLCDENAKGCDRDGPDGCWVEFTPAADAEASKFLLGGRYADGHYGQYWIEGKGRVARSPGGFGHLSSYKCQILLSSVGVMKKLPPGA